MRRIKFHNILFLIVLLAGCSVRSTNQCLPPPVTTIPNDMEQSRSHEAVGMARPGSIPAWWRVQPNWLWPYKINGTGKYYQGLSAIAVRNNIIWVAFSLHILKYEPQSGGSKSYTITDQNNNNFVISDLHFSQDGELWASVFLAKLNYVTIAHYDQKSDSFKIVSDDTGILKQQDNQYSEIYMYSQVLDETSDGKILMPFGKNIVAFDPGLNTVKYILPQDFSWPVAVIVVSRNKVWFSVSGNMDLRSLDLGSGELLNYGHASSILDDPAWAYYMKDSYRPIAIDKLGHVWMGYFARLITEPTGQYQWEQTIYSPEFVVADDPDYKYLWGTVESIFTTSDGNLWYSSSAGLVTYDPESDSWCKSMPISPPLAVTEDEKGNMWMAISSGKYNAIYKLEYPNSNK